MSICVYVPSIVLIKGCLLACNTGCCVSCSGHRRNRRRTKRRNMAETAANEMDLYPSRMGSLLSIGACPVSRFPDRAATVSAICCANEACPGETIPAVCSFDCARAFTTFLADCNDVLAIFLGAADMRKYTEFGNLCTNLDVRSLVTAIHESHCWYCGDGAVDDDEQCDAGDSADECESAPCQNGGVCFDGHGEYHCQCVDGFTGDACEQALDPIHLCHAEGGENDCDTHASCRHTGPGTHECTCLYGYGGDGHTCTEQGTTRCLADCTLEVHCPALPEVQGATITLSNGNIAPSTATYTCDGGAAPSDGDATRTCQADGSWTGTAPTSCGAFQGGQILTPAMNAQLSTWMEQKGLSSAGGWQLCYSSPNRDPRDAPSAWHSRCDGHPRTVVVAASTA